MGAADAGAAPADGALPPLNHVFSNMPTTIFSVMSALAVEHQSVNLGQGFPDDEGPASMKDVAARSLVEHSNQYPSLLGVPELRQAVAAHSERCQGLPIDPATEALVTVGATEGIAAAFMALVNPGDEVGCRRARPLWQLQRLGWRRCLMRAAADAERLHALPCIVLAAAAGTNGACCMLAAHAVLWQ